ncbi:hypothetical protein BGZ94_009201 [Podila epigama]|nr:hypothetical protein BGZ94_009201 [Podila epigama]
MANLKSPNSIAQEEKDALTIYIRNVTENMTQESLLRAFSVFGPIRVLNVVHPKACAFVEFTTPEAYKSALAATAVSVGNGEIVLTEMRIRRPHQQQQQQQQHLHHSLSRKISSNNIKAVGRDIKVDEGCDVSTNYIC